MPTIQRAGWGDESEPPTRPIENLRSIDLVKRERLRLRVHASIDIAIDALEPEKVDELLASSERGPF